LFLFTHTPRLSRRFLGLILIVTSAIAAAQTPPTPTLARTLDLHTHAEWRVNAQMQFDREGRLLILYRDKANLTPNGNWHLIRLRDPLSSKPLREELAFSLPQEPEVPRATDRWDDFHSALLLDSSSHAFVVFAGATCDELPGPKPTTSGNNVKCHNFSSGVSVDLKAFRVVAIQDISDHLDAREPWRKPATVNEQGELLTLHLGKEDWQITFFDPQLKAVRVVNLDANKDNSALLAFCSPTPEATLRCQSFSNKPPFLVTQAGIQPLPPSINPSCKAGGEATATQAGFGIDTRTNAQKIVESNALCRLDAASTASPLLLPLCHQGWRLAGISPDYHSVLADCSEMTDLLDTWFYISRNDIEVVDASTLQPIAYLKLSTRSRIAEAIFHADSRTIFATLKEGETLKLYTIPDMPKP
jgi:hypothetical protein